MTFTISDLGGIFSFVCAIITVIIGAIILFGGLFVDLRDRKKDTNNPDFICDKIMYLKDIVVLSRCFTILFSVYVIVEFVCRYFSDELTTKYMSEMIFGLLLAVIPILIIGNKKKKLLSSLIKEHSDDNEKTVSVCEKFKHLVRQIFIECSVCSVCVLAMAVSLTFMYVVLTDTNQFI